VLEHALSKDKEHSIVARTDDFQQARDLAAGRLAEQNLEEIARRSGFELQGEATVRVPFLNRVYRVTAPAFTFTDDADTSAAVPLQEQVLILHYMLGCQPHLKHQWVAYREIPGAGFYYGAFVKRAIEPLKKVFGQNVAGLKSAAIKLGATPSTPAMPLSTWFHCPLPPCRSSSGKVTMSSRPKPTSFSMHRLEIICRRRMRPGWQACRSIG
jgi:hypothetical protein